MQGVKELMDEMKVKDTVIQVRNQNYQRLQDELDKLVVSCVFVGEIISLW